METGKAQLESNVAEMQGNLSSMHYRHKRNDIACACMHNGPAYTLDDKSNIKK